MWPKQTGVSGPVNQVTSQVHSTSSKHTCKQALPLLSLLPLLLPLFTSLFHHLSKTEWPLKIGLKPILVIYQMWAVPGQMVDGHFTDEH